MPRARCARCDRGSQQSGAGRFMPERSFPEVKDLPNWNNVVPRCGVSYRPVDNLAPAKFGLVEEGTTRTQTTT